MKQDDLCQTAGVTKGAFFHHFESKEALGVAAAAYWAETTSAFFAGAPYHDHADPLDRLLGYVEFRKSIIDGDLAEFTCLVGTMTQEVYASHPADPRRLRGEHLRPCRDDRAGHRGCDDGARHRGGVDAREPRRPHPGRAAGRVHPRQGDRRTLRSHATASIILPATCELLFQPGGSATRASTSHGGAPPRCPFHRCPPSPPSNARRTAARAWRATCACAGRSRRSASPTTSARSPSPR